MVSAGEDVMPLHRTPRTAQGACMADGVESGCQVWWAALRLPGGPFCWRLRWRCGPGTPMGRCRRCSVGLTFVVYVPAFVWSYVSANQKLVWLVLAGGGTLMLLLAWWLQPA